MPPRQPFPVRGGMPRQMPRFGPNQMRPMMNTSRMGGMGMGNRGLSRVPMGMNGARGMGAAPKTRGGGLLAKLLGRGQSGGAQAGMQMLGNASRSAAVPSASGGLLKSITDPAAITGFLNNTQRVLNTAQQIGPMVQQYGPIIKNLPAMWKLYRGLNSASTEEENNSDSTESNETSNTLGETSEEHKEKKQARRKPIKSTIEIDEDEDEPINTKGKSVPKIYV